MIRALFSALPLMLSLTFIARSPRSWKVCKYSVAASAEALPLNTMHFGRRFKFVYLANLPVIYRRLCNWHPRLYTGEGKMSCGDPTEMTTLKERIDTTALPAPQKSLSHLPERPPVDIEFSDINYTVPTTKGSKLILRGVSGLFRSGQLTAILGPSGAGKSTLLNILAGYKRAGATGTILTNGSSRDMSTFRKLSRYIMQEDLVQPYLTVEESMTISAHLKLGNSRTEAEKMTTVSLIVGVSGKRAVNPDVTVEGEFVAAYSPDPFVNGFCTIRRPCNHGSIIIPGIEDVTINEILDMLRLNNCRKTYTTRLSGGERKRLSIALELVNNPPVIFLDEPTTGLDDLSSSQCITLLRALAQGGRTVICSVHTPSARLFAMFDHVYIVAQGSCVFQGSGRDIVPFLHTFGLMCPTHYNPADFIIEVASGEYGSYVDKMTAVTENGKVYKWRSPGSENTGEGQPFARTSPIQLRKDDYNFSSSGWSQFRILTKRMMLQMLRDSTYLVIKLILYIFVALVVGGMFYGAGNDASKTLFNFGFCFVCLIVLLYVPMLPVLLHFPSEIRLLKREYFNRWYGLTSYFLAMTLSRLPTQIIFSSVYVIIVYILTDQPLDTRRCLMFLTICIITGIISESLGLVLSSFLNVVNGIFMGPALSVPLMLLAVYGLGYGALQIPLYMKMLMYLSYLRYGLEGLILTIYGGNRANMICPKEEVYCHYKSPRTIIEIAGMENANVWVDLTALIAILFMFRVMSFLVLRFRLSTSKKFTALHRISQIIKTNFDITRKYS